MVNNKGISAIVATVLIVLITVAAVAIIWMAIIPMIQGNFGVEDFGAEMRVVSSQGYTVYDAEKEVVLVQVSRGADNSSGVNKVKIIIEFNGTTFSRVFDAPAPNGFVTYPINVSRYGIPIRVSVAPVRISGNKVSEGAVSSSVEFKNGNVLNPEKYVFLDLNESAVDDDVDYVTYYFDGDGDGYGSGVSGEFEEGEQTEGYYIAEVLNLSVNDCNDSDASVWQNLTGYIDSDADGYGGGEGVIICSGDSLPTGYDEFGEDCNDSDVNYGALEICDDYDNDCDGEMNEGCNGDTCFHPGDIIFFGINVGACEYGEYSCAFITTGYQWGVSLNRVIPSLEVCGNSIDDDCNGIVDDDCISCLTDSDCEEPRVFCNNNIGFCEFPWCNWADVNRDGVVNMTDAGLVGANMGSLCSLEDDWCNGSDMGRNGKVDADDITIWIINQGRTDCHA